MSPDRLYSGRSSALRQLAFPAFARKFAQNGLLQPAKNEFLYRAKQKPRPSTSRYSLSARPAGFFCSSAGLRVLTRGTWLLTPMRHLTSLARDMSRLLRYTRIWSRFRTLLLSPLLRPSGATLGCYSPLQRSRALGWRWGRVLILGSSLRC